MKGILQYVRINKVKIYLKEMRVHHYIKNVLVVAPLACSGELFNYHKLWCALSGLLAFCSMASAVYFINDIPHLSLRALLPLSLNLF